MASKEFCSSCGSELLSTESFCSSCGKKNLGFVEDFICEKCNARISSGEIFCSSCGTKKPNPRDAIKIIEAARPNYVKLFFHAIISIIFPIGIGLGVWHIFKNKNFKFGFFLINISVWTFIAFLILVPDESNDTSLTIPEQMAATKQKTTSEREKVSSPPAPAPVIAPKVTPVPSPSPTKVSLREILDLRDGNEVAADAKYIGMYVSMEGEIKEIHEKDLTIIPLNSNEFQMAGAKCQFGKSQYKELLTLRKGQSITIVGTIKDIDDFMFNMLEVKPCEFK